MENKYSIESLIEIFEIHSKKSKIMNEKLKEEFMENNPGTPLPNHFKDDFSIIKALKHMCEEIQKLKSK